MLPSAHVPPRRGPSPRHRACWVAAWTALWLATGCAQDLSLHARVGVPLPNPGEVPATTGLSVGGVVVERVELVLREVRLESRTTLDDQASLGREVLLPGPKLLVLSGSALEPDALTPILAGAHGGLESFFELDVDLRPVSPEEAAADPRLAPLAGESLRITGTFRGEPFTLSSDATAVLKGESAFILGTNHNNIDMNFDPTGWFLNPSGAVLDPGDPDNRSAIEQNFLRSFSAFEDDNRDGVPDPIE